jgi:membrane-bound lytic murein transglycosylase A
MRLNFSSRRMPVTVALAASLLASCQHPAPRPGQAPAQPARYVVQDIDQVDEVDDAQWLAAWPAWLAFCSSLAARDAAAAAPVDPAATRTPRSGWQDTCAQAPAVDAGDAAAIRAYLHRRFDLYRIEAPAADGEAPDSSPRGFSATGLITGYYEPLLSGSRTADERFSVPIYRVPPDLVRVELAQAYPQLRGLNLRGRLDRSGDAARVIPYWTRQQIEQDGRLRGVELIWVDDPVAAFFLQVQGSGRVQLPGGEQLRLAYADTNGQPYRSIGRWLVEQGEMTVQQASMQSIREWARTHPERVRELLDQNPSFVFFREAALGDPQHGPTGALGLALTPGYSVAVDPRFIPLGAPLIIDSVQPVGGGPLRRPVMAQDTGGAIRGPLRLDLFWGFGPDAEEAAGRQHAPVSIRMLVPKGLDPGSLAAP